LLLTSILVFPFVLFFFFIFATRFYMIWQANSADLNYSTARIFLTCLKFWDSKLLIKAYFGTSNNLGANNSINHVTGQ
jgi:hypothetical protein